MQERERLWLRQVRWESWRESARETMHRGRRSFAAIVGLGATAGFVWLWWKGVPALYQDSGAGPDARVQAVTGTRTALLVGLAGAGAVGALWLNNRTFRVTQLNHLTDRYTKAIEQLGSETVDVRLGGIYALEQLAVDSYRSRDQATIIEVLSAFVRVHSDPLYQRKYSLSSLASPPQPPEEQQAAKDYVAPQARPPVDVQAAVTVLGRLPDRAVLRGDLRGAYLRGADLGVACLKGVTLTDANLCDANLFGANLTLAGLANAKLTGARIFGAKLASAKLTCAEVLISHGLI